MATCRECKLFNLEAAKDKRGHVLSRVFVACLWKSKEQYPLSIYKPQRPHASYTSSKDGHNCPCFQKRDNKK